MPLRMSYGRTDFVRDENGAIVKTTLDETTLKKVAEATGGLYVPLGRGAEGLNTIYQEKLRLVPKSEQDQRMERIPLERFEWPLGAAIALLLMEFFIGDRRKLKKVRPLVSAARMTKVGPQATVSLVIGLTAIGISSSRAAELVNANPDPRKIYNQGTEAYTKGDFVKASESLRASLRTQDLTLQQRSYYNLGNTLYRTGQGTLEKDPEATIKTWEESLKAYQDGLALNPTDEDALYNKALVEKKLEELKKQQKRDDKKDDKNDDKEKKEDQDKKEEKDQKDGKDPQEDKDSKEGKDPKNSKNSKDGKDPKDPKDSKEGDKSKDGKDPKDEKGDKKPGDEKSAKDGGEPKKDEAKPGEKQEGSMSNERPQKQEMTVAEAKQLLDSLRQDERTVIPIPQPQRTRFKNPDNSTKGKTW